MKQENIARLRWILPRGFSLLSAIVGFVALLGWLLDIPLLATFGSSLIPMAPSTAILFILLGVSTFFQTRLSRHHRLYRLGLAIGVFAALLSLLFFILSSMGIYLDVENVGLQISATLTGTTLGHMSPVSALMFFLASSSFLALLSSSGHPRRSMLALGLAVLLILASYVFALAYFIGLPLLYGGKTIPPSLPTSLAFLALGMALALAAQAQARPEGQPGRHPFARIPYTLLLLLGILALGIFTVGYVYYRNYERQLRSQVEAQLSSIAELKISQLENWRSESMADAESVYQNPVFAALVQTNLAHPEDAKSKVQLQAWLDALGNLDKYDHVFLLDSTGMERISSFPRSEPVGDYITRNAAAAMASRQVTFVDFYRDTTTGPIHLALMVPVLDPQVQSNPIGVLVMRIDPDLFLYPFIQRWPVPSTSAETLLVRQDGNSVLFLNELRFQQDTALNLHFPLSDTQLLAVKAVSGQEGVVQGLDYRGQTVMGYVGPVPGSPWFIVARMDLAEAYAPLTARMWQTILFFGVLILALGAGLVIIWRQQRVRFYRSQAELVGELRETNEYLDNLFNFANAPIIVWDPLFRITRFNHAFEALTGLNAPEILGKPLEILFPPKQVEASMELIRKTITGEHWEVVEISIQQVNGSVHTVLWNSATLFSPDGKKPVATIAQGQDITERKQAEDMIQARLRLVEYSAHHTLQEVLQNTLDEVCVITNSPIGFYHFVEPDQKTLSLQAWSTRTLQEYCKAESTGLHYELDQAGVWADCLRQRQPVIHNDYLSLPHRRDLPAGHAVLVRELVVPIMRDDLVVAILGVGNNAREYVQKDVETVTFFADVAWELARRKRIEQELTQYTENLEELVAARTAELRLAQEKILRQERLATLGQVAGSIGHELRNPLGVISNAVYFLKMAQPDVSDKVKEYLQIIENETHTSNKFITELLDFTRMKALDRKSTLVPELVSRTLDRYPLPPQVELSVDLPPDLPSVFVDPSHIVQVLGNLTVNACQAMHDIGKLVISAGLDNDMIRIAVQDTGEGITPGNMEKLFEPLFTTKIKGIGLGLAVCKKLVDSNEGRIEVHSEPGAGSTFTIFLPIYPS